MNKLFDKYIKRILECSICIAAVVVAVLIATHQYSDSEIVILYTNDIHSNISKDLSYASVAGIKNKLIANGKQVVVVDAGDHVQGAPYGGMDEGASIVQLMNAVGYQVATLGNHEFDYGLERAFQIVEEADFPYVSSNFYKVKDEQLVLAPYSIIELDGVKLAFIGISTPETIRKSSPKTFMDEKGDYIYDFYSGEDGCELYDSVQKAIDEASQSADYIFALGHLGDSDSSFPYRSIDVIEHVSGLDAFIDGHSHTVMESMMVEDADGKPVLLSQTGSKLDSIGQLTISPNGEMSAQLITESEDIDAHVQELEQAWIAEVNDALDEKIAVLDNKLYFSNPDDPSIRIVRNTETNLGDAVSDACYYYFNEILGEECDVAITNGGGIRSDIEAGDITLMETNNVYPFGNDMCMIKATGQQILDAIELGVMYIGKVNPDTNLQAESGGFLQVSGARFQIDTTIESTVRLDENDIWEAGPDEYRVKNLEIYNRVKEEYEPIDLSHEYRLAGVNFLLRNMGDGMAMFSDCECIIDYTIEDYQCIAEYFRSFSVGDDGFPHINSENSPLSSYENYMIDYENPYGAGRIS